MSSFGGTVKLTGESEYKKALADISGNLKLLNSEMKAVTSQYDKNDTSVENLSSQNEVLNKKIDEQERKVKLLKQALEDASKETGENSDTTKKWQAELNNAQAELNNLNRNLDTNTQIMNETAEANKKGYKSIEEMAEAEKEAQKETLTLGDIIKANLISEAIMGGLSALGDAIKGVGAKFGEFLALGEETKETQQQMASLEASFDSAGLGAENATKTMSELQGVLGDTGRSTEASNLLAKMSKDQKDLEANTRILTGVFAEYGDSIPTEGLAEGMQATAQMGSVQGVLADALEWQGVNLDEYNDKLETMTSAEERASYIQQTLTSIYGESADAYRKNNEALIASNEANLKAEQAMAKLGQTALPVSTGITNIKTSLIEGFTPAISEAVGGFGKLTNSFSDLIGAVLSEEGVGVAFDNFSAYLATTIEGIENAIPDILYNIDLLLWMVIELIQEHLPDLVSKGAEMLSSLLEGIVNYLPELIPVVLSVVETLLNTILENLPMIIEMGIQMLVSLIQGITDMLPELIPTVINALLLMVDTLLDNIDLIIDAGIELIMALVEGLLDALPDLVEKIPEIIDKLVDAIFNNFPKILDAGIEIIIQLAVGLVQAIPQLASKVPTIVAKIVKGLVGAIPQLIKAGGDLLAGLFKGLLDPQTIWNSVKSLFNGIIGGIKELFGIHSPSTVFADIVGKNLALGLGEGFDDTMSDVTKEMANAIPTEFDAEIGTNLNVASGQTQMSTFDMMVLAFKQALTEVKVVMDDREMGTFVTNTVEKVVYA